MGKISTFYRDDKDIKLAVLETIPSLERKHNPSGWISGSAVADTKPLIDEIGRLNGQLADLKRQLEMPRSNMKVNEKEADIQELLEVLRKDIIDVRPLKRSSVYSDWADSVSVYKVLTEFQSKMLAGIKRAGYMDPESHEGIVSSYLWNVVCPKMEIHDVTSVERVSPGGRVVAYVLSIRGRALVAAMARDAIMKG